MTDPTDRLMNTLMNLQEDFVTFIILAISLIFIIVIIIYFIYLKNLQTTENIRWEYIVYRCNKP